MVQTDENALVEAAQRGDLSAFNVLLSAYQQPAYQVAHRILGDADSAADAVQDSLIKVYDRIHQFRGGSFKAWLCRVVINTCYDRLRGERRRRTSQLDDDEILPEHDLRLMDANPTPHDQAESSELMAAMMADIRKLPPEQQRVLLMCDVEGLAYHEAAFRTGSNLGTVKSRLSRARAKMRDALTRNGIVPPACYTAPNNQRASNTGGIHEGSLLHGTWRAGSHTLR